MRPDTLFWMELAEDLRRRSGLALKFALPVILVLPLAIVKVPDAAKFAGLPLIVLFLGVLGSSVGLSRLKEKGLIERLSGLPTDRRKLMGQYLSANVLMDGLQMMAPTAIVATALGVDVGMIGIAVIGLALSILFANSLGIMVAIASGGSGEVHLFSALCVLGVAGVSGLFSVGSSLIGEFSSALPFGLVARAFEAGAQAGLAQSLLLATIGSFTVAGIALLGSERLFRR